MHATTRFALLVVILGAALAPVSPQERRVVADPPLSTFDVMEDRSSSCRRPWGPAR
jgi:hypothetical protein